MGVFFTWLGSLIAAGVRAVGPTLLATLGLSLATEAAMSAFVMPNLQSYFNDLPTYVFETVGALRADVAFSILASAIVVRQGVRASRVMMIKRR